MLAPPIALHKSTWDPENHAGLAYARVGVNASRARNLGRGVHGGALAHRARQQSGFEVCA